MSSLHLSNPFLQIEGWSRCQKLGIDQQLYGGIRFLDLRLMNQGADIWCHHNLVICMKLKDVLESVRDFINDNKSEIVFLYLTNDGKHLEWPTVNALVNEYLSERLIFESQRDMLIGKHKVNVMAIRYECIIIQRP